QSCRRHHAPKDRRKVLERLAPGTAITGRRKRDQTTRSLRRYEPDQVRWVSLAASQPRLPGTPQRVSCPIVKRRVFIWQPAKSRFLREWGRVKPGCLFRFATCRKQTIPPAAL